MRINSIQCSQNNRVNFGWNVRTHAFLTKAALEYVPELAQYSKFLSIGVHIADLHPKYTSLLQVGKWSHSYFGRNALEYDLVPQNAFDMFYENLTDLQLLLRAGMKRLAMYKAGITLHFLQDMSVPLHSNQDCYGGLKKIIKHFLYELKTKSQKGVIEGMSPSERKTVNFYDNFIATYEKSRLMRNPFEIKDKKLTDESVKEALVNGYDATYNFLLRLNKAFRAQNKPAFFFEEFENSEFLRSMLLKKLD